MIHCSLHFDKHKKAIAYIYVRFNQNLDEKSYVRAIFEAGKHLHADFLLIVKVLTPF